MSLGTGMLTNAGEGGVGLLLLCRAMLLCVMNCMAVLWL
jgi:hypothetical protein